MNSTFNVIIFGGVLVWIIIAPIVLPSFICVCLCVHRVLSLKAKAPPQFLFNGHDYQTIYPNVQHALLKIHQKLLFLSSKIKWYQKTNGNLKFSSVYKKQRQVWLRQKLRDVKHGNPVDLEATNDSFDLRRGVQMICRSHFCNIHIVWSHL